MLYIGNMSLVASPVDTPIIGSSPAFLDLMDQVSQVARLDRPVLVIGERGTGKELVAARLHFLSRRWENALVKLNCAALPETLLESELFGYEPGAFTGASRQREGRFDLADRGTLFLDEIATMSMPAQEKLLRVVEYGEFERLGGSDTIRTDVRVIGATNIDLPAAADEGRFRHDLLDRLAFDVLTMPPLRARQEDILDLAVAFGANMARELNWPGFFGFAEDVIDQMLGYHWPGNIRELKNAVERAVYRWADPDEPVGAMIFDPFDSPWRPAPPAYQRLHRQEAEKPTEVQAAVATTGHRPVDDFRAAVADYEKALLTRAMDAAKHNQTRAARQLGLSYDQLRHALKKHDLT